ncbi:hypothetical protein N9H39_10900, partial [Gammaproteobacteria bacterium]|nr:hypothetical protein [Gammaproteobacteria bacterium]
PMDPGLRRDDDYLTFLHAVIEMLLFSVSSQHPRAKTLYQGFRRQRNGGRQTSDTHWGLLFSRHNQEFEPLPGAELFSGNFDRIDINDYVVRET